MFGNDRILAPIGARSGASFVVEWFGVFGLQVFTTGFCCATSIKAAL